MANHNLPTQSSTYTNFVAELDARFDDLCVGLDPTRTTMTNLPTNSVGWSSAGNKWQRWTGSAWTDLATTYSISIGGNANTATQLQTARTINGVSFNGTVDINVPTQNSITFSNTEGAAVGTTFNGSAARTISHVTVGAPSVTGSGASGSWGISVTGTAANVTGTVAVANGGTGASTAAGARTNLGLVIGTDVPSVTGVGANGTWGINISGNANTSTTATNVTGTIAIANGGTGQTTAINAFNALKQASTEGYSGVVELATAAEAAQGTDTTRAVTPAGLEAHMLANAIGWGQTYSVQSRALDTNYQNTTGRPILVLVTYVNRLGDSLVSSDGTTFVQVAGPTDSPANDGNARYTHSFIVPHLHWYKFTTANIHRVVELR